MLRMYGNEEVALLSSTFDVYFAGETVDGFDREKVGKGLGKLFGAKPEQIAHLMSGARCKIKTNCDKATALKYREAMANIGAKALIERSGSAHETTQPAAQEVPSRPEANREGMDALYVDRGAREPAHFDSHDKHGQEPDTVDWVEPEKVEPKKAEMSIAPPGSIMSEHVHQEPYKLVKTPDYDLAPAGAEIPNLPKHEEKLDPDVSQLRLVPLEH